MPDFTLCRDAFGHLQLTGTDGVQHSAVVPVRAFPVSAGGEGIALVSRDGHELRWIARPNELPEAMRTLVEEELAAREFMPVIEQIEGVSSFATPSTWRVRTGRGPTQLVLRGEEDIRQLGNGALLIADTHGIVFLIEDVAALDRHSRRLLDRFL